MAKQDYYATLGVARDASSDDIRKAYRKLAMQYHPDRNPGDASAEAKFKEINEANDVLTDEQKRGAYDRFGHAAFENGGGGQQGFGDGAGLGDIFDQMFGEFMGGGRGRGRRGPRAGNDIRAAVEISMEEAFGGSKKTIRVPTRVSCEACSGTGSESKEATSENCAACGGSGKVRAQQGFFIVERTCPTCSGAGRVVRNPCRICAGSGTVQRERSLQVNIPAGVEDGTRIRLTGEGEAGGPGGPPGDLFVHIGVRAHEIFQREGANILCHVPIRMTQAALGADVEVPSIDGSKARVKIPPGTQTGAQFRLRNKGFSVLRSHQRGDMFIQITVETPQHLTAQQRELLEKFESDATAHGKGSPQTAGFFAKVRDFFDKHGRG